MRVAICCKAVPVDIPLESVSVINGDIRCTGVDLYVNEIDAYALEAALFLKSKYKVETIALTLGPLRAQEVLYIALAKGIDQILRINGETSRPELIASGLIPALEEIKPQIILAGAQSEDWMGGEVGVYLSQALNTGLAFAVIEICDLNDTYIRIKKEIGGGKKAEVALKLPAVLCVQSGIQPLRYLSMAKRQKVRNNPIKLWSKLESLDGRKLISGMMAYEAEEVSPPLAGRHAEMIIGERSEKVAKLLELISSIV
jgi:electron transfer flavoprotein beta subunit